ncbi:MAG: aminotransferase class V-fold PLP-dependent enzyme, partial [Phycisphaerales bacterium]|nr:aminotransferase class V-fold PLP-dependent enzyme [Phycisphaerales bacterium]
MQEQPTYSNLVEHWGLDRSLTFLNHGSYGACPLRILECQDRYRAQMERDPVRFMVVDLERQLDESREAAASFLNCPPSELVFVRNATIGLCTILNSIDWAEGDQVLVNDHEYPSLKNELERMRERDGLVPVVAKVPFPIEREED